MKKILIVEDERILAEMYVDKLTQAGFKVIVAGNAKDGLDSVKKEKPDFILLDILLPGDNGIQFLKKIRKDPELASLPVVVFSNFDDAEIKNQAKELGAKDYLLKTNYTPQEIVEKIMKYLE